MQRHRVRHAVGIVIRVLLVAALAVLCLCASPLAAQSEITYTEIAQIGRGTAYALAWRPDGTILAVGGSAGVWFYDADFTPVGHSAVGSVHYVEWRPDGQRLALLLSGGETQIRTFAGTQLGAPMLTLPAAENWLDDYTDLSWSPDGTRLAMSKRTVTHIVDAASGRVLIEIAGSQERMSWSPDGRLLAGVLQGGAKIGLWESETGQMLRVLNPNEANMYFGALAFSPDGRTLASGTSLPSAVFRWDVESGRLLSDPPPDLSNPTALRQLAWDETGDRLLEVSGAVEADRYFQATITDMRTGQEQHSVGFPDGVWRAAWMPGHNAVTLLNFSGKLRQWDLDSDKFQEYALHTPSGMFAAWSPDSSRIAASAQGDSMPVHVWDVRSGERISLFTPHIMTGIRWLPDSSHLVTIGENLPIWIAVYFAYRWNTDTGRADRVIMETVDQGGPLPIVDWTRDFKQSAWRSYDGTELRIGTDNAPERFSLAVDEDVIVQIQWSPDGTRVATLSAERTDTYTKIGRVSLQVWDAETGALISRFGAMNWSSSVGWSPDSSTLTLMEPHAGYRYTLHIIDAATGAQRFETHYAWMPRLQWNATGDKFAIVQTERNSSLLQIISAQTGERLAERKYHTAPISPAWHPQRDILALAAGDTLDLLDGTTLEPLATFAPGDVSPSWSPDGTMLALFDSGTIRIWQMHGFADQ
jgi:WD40 repeat protein